MTCKFSPLLLLAALTGCAAPPPIPFDLVADSRIYHGSFDAAERRIEVSVGERSFQGFYIVASGSALSQGPWLRRGMPPDTLTTYSSNSARAILQSADGERLSCEFVFEGNRAIGACKGGDGKNYQLFTQAR